MISHHQQIGNLGGPTGCSRVVPGGDVLDHVTEMDGDGRVPTLAMPQQLVLQSDPLSAKVLDLCVELGVLVLQFVKPLFQLLVVLLLLLPTFTSGEAVTLQEALPFGLLIIVGRAGKLLGQLLWLLLMLLLLRQLLLVLLLLMLLLVLLHWACDVHLRELSLVLLVFIVRRRGGLSVPHVGVPGVPVEVGIHCDPECRVEPSVESVSGRRGWEGVYGCV